MKADLLWEVLKSHVTSLATKKGALISIEKVNDRLAATPDMPLSVDVNLKQYNDGRIVMQLSRQAHHSEGYAAKHVRVQKLVSGNNLSPEVTASISTMMAEVARLQARDRAITAAGASRVFPPAWAYQIHRLPMALLRWANVDVSDMISTSAVPSNAKKVGFDGFPLASPFIQGPRFGGSKLFRKGDQVRMHPLVLEARRPDYSPISRMHFTSGRSPRLTVYDTQIPQMVATDLKGRQLADVVSHPAFAGLGPLRITMGDSIDNSLVLHIENVHEPLAETPDLIDDRWRYAD